MKVYEEIPVCDLEAWQGAKHTLDTIIEAGLEDDLEELLENEFPNGVGKTELNDFLWFSDEYIFDCLGIPYEE